MAPTHSTSHGIEFTQLGNANLYDADPRLVDLFIFCVQFIRMHLGRDRMIYITSVKRGAGVHSLGRAVDFAPEGIEGKDCQRVLLRLRNHVNLAFPYTMGNGNPGYTFIYKQKTRNYGDDPGHERHVHLQMPADGWQDILG